MLRLLLCTNGSTGSETALRVGARLALTLKLPALALGILEREGRRGVIEAQIEHNCRPLRENGLLESVRIDVGDAVRSIVAEARPDDLTVVGPLGRPAWWRFLNGPSVRHLLQRLVGPVLFTGTRVRSDSLRKILICAGGLSSGDAAVALAGQIASAAGAEATLMHVASPHPALPEPVRDQLTSPEAYLQTDTVYARNIRRALADLEARAIAVRFVLRKGDPLLEIQAEAHATAYDLVAIGSHYSLTGPARLVGDITHRIVEEAGSPVLVVRGQSQPVRGVVEAAVAD